MSKYFLGRLREDGTYQLQSGFNFDVYIETYTDTDVVVIFQALGGDERWIDRFLAQHIAVAYYLLTVLMYLLSPRMACKYFGQY